MTAHSQNGYEANNRALIRSYLIPGTDVKLAFRAGNVAYVMTYVFGRFNREVEKLHKGWCWGYAERPIRGSTTTLSNHASGTAGDADAPLHPLGTQPTANYSKAQIAAIHRILNFCVVDGVRVIRWGGDYTGRKDGMHFEINASISHVMALVAKIKGVNALPVVSPSRIKVQHLQSLLRFAPSRRDGKWGPDTDQRALYLRTASRYVGGTLHGSSKATIKLIQRVVGAHADGIWGPKSRAHTKVWIKDCQALLGVPQTGNWDATTDRTFLEFRAANYKRF